MTFEQKRMAHTHKETQKENDAAQFKGNPSDFKRKKISVISKTILLSIKLTAGHVKVCANCSIP